jgi:hypothetical protein
MIQFRCWHCNKAYMVAEDRVGERLACSCKARLRIPKESGGNCRVKSPTDWLVEGLVYGGGGALLGLGLALLVLSQWRGLAVPARGWVIVPALTAVGFLAGLLGGERGVSWVGRLIRDRENR